MTLLEAEHALALVAERIWDKRWGDVVGECAELGLAIMVVRDARAESRG